jgi:hypothetical protein
MGEVVHTSRIQITREKGPVRKAFIEGFSQPVYYGMHGGIKRFYKVEPEEEHAGGCRWRLNDGYPGRGSGQQEDPYSF